MPTLRRTGDTTGGLDGGEMGKPMNDVVDRSVVYEYGV